MEKLLNKAKLQKNGIMGKIKDLKTQEQIVNELANVELSDDEVEGRSVCQEIDYSNKKRAMKEIKLANYDQIQKSKHKRMNANNLRSQFEDLVSTRSGVSAATLSKSHRSKKSGAISNAAKSILSSQASAHRMVLNHQLPPEPSVHSVRGGHAPKNLHQGDDELDMMAKYETTPVKKPFNSVDEKRSYEYTG